MNTLSYLSVMSQSLVRYDMANEMLNWAASMSETKLKKMNFRQMKKLLQKKGWEYERPYPYKGRLCCTVSLLDIVRGEESKKFTERHSDIMSTLDKTNASLRGSRVVDEDICHMYLTPIQSLDIQKVGRLRRDVPKVDIHTLPKDFLPETIKPPANKYFVDRDVAYAYMCQTAPLPTEPERFQEANQIVSHIVEGKIEDNPLDLYGIVTRPYQAQLVSDMRRQTSIENPINEQILSGTNRIELSEESMAIVQEAIDNPPAPNDKLRELMSRNKIVMGNSLKTTLETVTEHKDTATDILFSLKSLAARHPELDPMDFKLSCGEIEGLTDEAKSKALGLAAKYFAENFNLNEALKGVELTPGYSLSVIPKDETND